MSQSDSPEPVHYLAAITLALEASANDETALKVIDAIVSDCPKANGSDTWPTRLLVTAIQKVGARIEVPGA